MPCPPLSSEINKKWNDADWERKRSSVQQGKPDVERPHIGQGRVGSRRKKRLESINQPINKASYTVTENSLKIRNRNKENKQHAFQRSDTFHKQHEW